ncbi:MAG: hypothetical protein LJE91_13245 [Gammaproteobacteria bacterium]|nr:hypothetical protein [Gammaproteobacteria bacterium]
MSIVGAPLETAWGVLLTLYAASWSPSCAIFRGRNGIGPGMELQGAELPVVAPRISTRSDFVTQRREINI